MTATSTSDKSSHLPAVFDVTYPCGSEIVAHFAKELGDFLEFESTGRFTRVRMIHAEAEILLSNVDPIRIQLVKEINRVIEVYRYLLELIKTDTNYCSEEMDLHGYEKKWLKDLRKVYREVSRDANADTIIPIDEDVA